MSEQREYKFQPFHAGAIEVNSDNTGAYLEIHSGGLGVPCSTVAVVFGTPVDSPIEGAKAFGFSNVAAFVLAPVLYDLAEMMLEGIKTGAITVPEQIEQVDDKGVVTRVQFKDLLEKISGLMTMRAEAHGIPAEMMAPPSATKH